LTCTATSCPAWTTDRMISHILSGLDDGPDDIEGSVAMARIAVADGIGTIVATPHVGTSSWNPPSEVILQATTWLRQRLQDDGIELELLAGSELAPTADMKHLADTGQIAPLGENGRFLLIELPFFGALGPVEQQLFQLEVAGYKILLAHPERSAACLADPDLLPRLHDRGYWVQLNVASLIGRQGRRARNACARWLRRGLVDVIASDGHNSTRRKPVLSPARKTVLKIGGEELWKQLTVQNPARVLDSHRD